MQRPSSESFYLGAPRSTSEDRSDHGKSPKERAVIGTETKEEFQERFESLEKFHREKSHKENLLCCNSCLFEIHYFFPVCPLSGLFLQTMGAAGRPTKDLLKYQSQLGQYSHQSKRKIK